MAKLIKVTIDPNSGDFSVDLTGFNGKGCSDVIKIFDNLGDTKKSIKKPGFHQTTTTTVKR